MIPLDAQQQRLLGRLREAGDRPVAFAELRAGEIDFPAAVVSELELNGCAIERVHDHGRLVGVRLLHPEPPDAPDTRHAPAAPAAPAAPIGGRSTPAITADGPGCSQGPGAPIRSARATSNVRSQQPKTRDTELLRVDHT
jgi:hypothetical protein